MIVQHDTWEFSEKGIKDSERHRQKVDEHIRKSVRNVIAEENIITDRSGKKVRIPIKGLRDYRFIFDRSTPGGGGIGQGESQPGDVIYEKDKGGQQPGQGGTGKPGEDYIEVEVDIDYLLQIMFDDLGLPYIEQKTSAQHLVPKGWTFHGIQKKPQIAARLHKKRTMIETIKRTASLVGVIMEELGIEDEDLIMKALIQSSFDINDAIVLIKENRVDLNIEPALSIEDDDTRFKNIEQDFELQSNAVLIAGMDVSGSMTTDKKYLARSLLFWLCEFLKKTYENVDTVFITHTTEAQEVDEETFFHRGESGGTHCHTAFDKVNYLIDTRYPTDTWNVYFIYISDGEDFDTAKTVQSVSETIAKKINMIAYGEVGDLQSDEDSNFTAPSWWGGMQFNLWEALRKGFNMGPSIQFMKKEDIRLFMGQITGKQDIFPFLKHILFEKRK